MKGLKKAMVSGYYIPVSHTYRQNSAGVELLSPAILPHAPYGPADDRTCLGQRVIPNRNPNHLSHLPNQDSIPPIPIPPLAHHPPPLHLPLIDQVDHL